MTLVGPDEPPMTLVGPNLMIEFLLANPEVLKHPQISKMLQ
jgi:hypothetical protein